MNDPLRPLGTDDDEPWYWQTASTADVLAHSTELDEFFDSLRPPRYAGAWLTAAIVAALVGVVVVVWRLR